MAIMVTTSAYGGNQNFGANLISATLATGFERLLKICHATRKKCQRKAKDG